MVAYHPIGTPVPRDQLLLRLPVLLVVYHSVPVRSEAACPLGCLLPPYGYLSEVRLPVLMVAYHLIPVRVEAACPHGCLSQYTCPR